YSGGMKRRLNIAVGLINHPQVLFMDEPTVGIDAQSRRHIIDTIKKLNQQGLTILYTTHHLDEVEEIADRIGIIDHGALLAVGTLKELVDSIDDAESIEFELEAMPDAADLQKILAVRDVRDALVSSGKLLVTVVNANGVLASLVQALNLLGLVIASIKLIRPDLEAVFLSLTGRTLRD
ncbi:MAG: ATP-binding cassette domain-containing protein, partial [Iodobacter sp.]